MATLPAGPTEPPAIQTLRWVFRPLAFMESARRRYGDTFSVRFMGFESPMVMLSDPETIRALYTGRDHSLPPGRTFALRPLLGARSVLLLEGREHLDRRRLMLPAFHGERMRAYESVVREATERELASWPTGRAVRAAPEHAGDHARGHPARGLRRQRRAARRAAAHAAARPARPDRDARTAVRRPARAAHGPPGPARADRARCAPASTRCSPQEIAERRADPQVGEREDILSLLVAARFEDGSGMDDEELRDQLMTLLVAGHETTATALAWTFDLLLHNPSTLARLQAELVRRATRSTCAR